MFDQTKKAPEIFQELLYKVRSRLGNGNNVIGELIQRIETLHFRVALGCRIVCYDPLTTGFIGLNAAHHQQMPTRSTGRVFHVRQLFVVGVGGIEHGCTHSVACLDLFNKIIQRAILKIGIITVCSGDGSGSAGKDQGRLRAAAAAEAGGIWRLSASEVR